MKKKKFNLKALERSRIKKKMVKITIAYSLVVVLLLGVCVIALNTRSIYRSYSDDNTIRCEGKVVNVYTEQYEVLYIKRLHNREKIHITFESNEDFVIGHHTFRDCGYGYDEFKTLILNKKVEIRYDKKDEEKLVYLRVGEKEIVTYDIVNEISFEQRASSYLLYGSAIAVVCMIYVIQFAQLRSRYALYSI